MAIAVAFEAKEYRFESYKMLKKFFILCLFNLYFIAYSKIGVILSPLPHFASIFAKRFFSACYAHLLFYLELSVAAFLALC